ncbi:SAM-dependent methyltransferase [Desulfopila sp. IMCC35006]|uniref:methyltransferase n=1 Tax=Desulfopila sp. IMCC35006 TaxID=2569542 RepID=UPI0010ACBD8F|nr:methyltransferase [Desulfopila sp. IMCC35006]TKB25625.1 SAM-dependent methyltransferase [Desulfopila sp. IMCC35006]
MIKEWNVPVLLGVSSGYWRGCALQAGVRLQLFTVLGDAGGDVVQVAGSIGAELRATGLLLDALSAMGLLRKTDSGYANTDFSRKYLVAGRPEYQGHIILHHHHILDGWAQLDEAVKSGRRVNRRSYGAEVERESFLMGMFNLAMMIAPQMAEKFQLVGRKRLLDLGGGPGTYSIHFCLANPELTAVILDRPTTEPFARQTAAKFQLAERIDFIGGDFNTDPIAGGPYDVAWLSHILHSNSLEECQECLTKTVAAMEPGGLLLIHDFILNDTKDGPEFPALFALNMLVGTDHGRAYSCSEIITMLERAGVVDIAHHVLALPNDSSVISGVKKRIES